MEGTDLEWRLGGGEADLPSCQSISPLTLLHRPPALPIQRAAEKNAGAVWGFAASAPASVRMHMRRLSRRRALPDGYVPPMRVIARPELYRQ